jgi:hypothetical protein
MLAETLLALGPWSRAGAPHKRLDHLPWGDPLNHLGLVYGDQESYRLRDPAGVRSVRDHDGCTSKVVGVHDRERQRRLSMGGRKPAQHGAGGPERG